MKNLIIAILAVFLIFGVWIFKFSLNSFSEITKESEIEKTILKEISIYGMKSATNTIELVKTMNENSQMTDSNLNYFKDSILIYSDSIEIKVSQLEK